MNKKAWIRTEDVCVNFDSFWTFRQGCHLIHLMWNLLYYITFHQYELKCYRSLVWKRKKEGKVEVVEGVSRGMTAVERSEWRIEVTGCCQSSKTLEDRWRQGHSSPLKSRQMINCVLVCVRVCEDRVSAFFAQGRLPLSVECVCVWESIRVQGPQLEPYKADSHLLCTGHCVMWHAFMFHYLSLFTDLTCGVKLFLICFHSKYINWKGT